MSSTGCVITSITISLQADTLIRYPHPYPSLFSAHRFRSLFSQILSLRLLAFPSVVVQFGFRDLSSARVVISYVDPWYGNRLKFFWRNVPFFSAATVCSVLALAV